MQRHSAQWFEALDTFLEQRRPKPFAWGRNDCCTFAADWVQLARGADPMAGLRGLNTAMAAARVVRDEGGILAAVSARLGEPLPGTMAQVGDVVLVNQAGRQSMGVCVGAVVAIPGDDAMALAPLTLAEAAWRV